MYRTFHPDRLSVTFLRSLNVARPNNWHVKDSSSSRGRLTRSMGGSQLARAKKRPTGFHTQTCETRPGWIDKKGKFSRTALVRSTSSSSSFLSFLPGIKLFACPVGGCVDFVRSSVRQRRAIYGGGERAGRRREGVGEQDPCGDGGLRYDSLEGS